LPIIVEALIILKKVRTFPAIGRKTSC